VTLKDLVKTSLSNLGRYRVRTVLSSVGVTVGILTIVTMLSLGVGVKREIAHVLEGVGLETVRIRPATEEGTPLTQFLQPQRTVLITQEFVDEMRARQDVIDVRPEIDVPWGINISLRIGDEAIPITVDEVPWGPAEPFAAPPELVAGAGLVPGDEGKIYLSSDSLTALGLEGREAAESLVGQQVELVVQAPRGDTEVFSLQVTGVFEPKYGFDGPYFDAHIGVADALALKAWWYNDPDILAHDGYDALMIRAATLSDAAEIVNIVEGRGFGVTSLQSMLEQINQVMILVQTMLGSVGGLALLVASLGIVNTMVMSIYERTREIGILKAVGASPGNIRLLFVMEAALIGLIGGVAGVIGGWLLSLGLNEGILAYLAWREVPLTGTFFVLTGWLVALALFFATIVGLLAGLYPAARAARLEPLDALRYE